MNDEVLVKGKDGKWYVLKGGELLPYEQKTEDRKQKTPVPERSSVRGTAEIIQPVRPPSSVLRPQVPPISSKPSTSFSHEGHPLRVELDELVTQVIENVKLKMQNVKWLDDPVLQKRFRTIVSARLRDVRDSAETKAMLLRDQKIGGMGMNRDQVTTTGDLVIGVKEIKVEMNRDQVTTTGDLVTGVMAVIEKAFAEFQNKWQAVEKKRIEEWKKSQRAQRDQQDQQKQTKEQEELKQRYEKMTGKVVVKEVKVEMNRDQVTTTGDLVTGVKEVKVTTTGGLVTGVKEIKVEMNRDQAIVDRDQATTTGGLVTGVKGVKKLAVPPPPSIQKTEVVRSIRPPSSVLRPPSKITDVRPAPRLVGPIEELSSITLKDFRRIAATPQAGTDKIISKVDFLSKESLTRRTEGIKAWQASPLFKTYSKISATALSGRCSPQSVLERFTTEGQSVLTLEEFYAIMELNRRLRY